MRVPSDTYRFIYFCCFLAFVGSSNQNFIQNLQRNVDEYRTSHFSWNIQNLDQDNYKSLRAIEANNDRTFREFLLSHSPKVKHLLASEHVAMDGKITNDEYGDKMRETYQSILKKREEVLPQRMEYAHKADMPQLMSYVHPQTMVYATNDEDTATLKKRQAELPQMMAMPIEEVQHQIHLHLGETTHSSIKMNRSTESPLSLQKREATNDVDALKLKKRETELPQMMTMPIEEVQQQMHLQLGEATHPSIKMNGSSESLLSLHKREATNDENALKLKKREAELPQMMTMPIEEVQQQMHLQLGEATHLPMRMNGRSESLLSLHKREATNDEDAAKLKKKQAELPQMMTMPIKEEQQQMHLQLGEATHLSISMNGSTESPLSFQKREATNDEDAATLKKREAELPQMMAMQIEEVQQQMHLQLGEALHPPISMNESTESPLSFQKREATNDKDTATLKKREAELPQMMAMPIKELQQQMRLQQGEASHPPIRMKGSTESLLSLQKREADNTSQMMVYNLHPWFSIADLMSLTFPKEENVYFNSWSKCIVLFGNTTIDREEFENIFHRLPLQIMIEQLSLTDTFQHIFWPFNFDQAFMNQRLALLGMSGLLTNENKQKERFYAELEKHQTIKVPVEEERVILIFDHPDLVEGLNRSGLLEMSKTYVDAGNHLYTFEEQEYITSKVQAAMGLINSTNPELYRAIHQIIACIAFFKAEHPGSVGGTISSSLGVIWQDPSVYREQSVAHYAEQIVHEFIHSSLFLADMVHGTYVDRSMLSKTKVYSPVRKELRDFDKTFHASYVTTGVAIFQSRAGNLENAQTYADTLRAAVDGLIAVQNEAGVLNAIGAAMLQAMDDVLTLIRMK